SSSKRSGSRPTSNQSPRYRPSSSIGTDRTSSSPIARLLRSHATLLRHPARRKGLRAPRAVDYRSGEFGGEGAQSPQRLVLAEQLHRLEQWRRHAAATERDARRTVGDARLETQLVHKLHRE